MARPPKAESAKKAYRLIVRLNTDERKAVETIAKTFGLKSYQFARLKTLGAHLPKPILPGIEQATYIELKKIGVNLNQLTRAANSGRLPGGIKELLISLLKQQDEIIKCLLK